MGDYEKDVMNYNLQKEKKERIKDSVIWIGLGIIFAMLLSIAVYMQILDARLKYTGKSIEVPYKISGLDKSIDLGGNIVKTNVKGILYTADDGVTRVCKNVDSLSAHNGDNITLYYIGDQIDQARPLTVLWFWILMDTMLGGLLVLCIYKFYKGSKMTRHYTGDRIS